MTLVDLAANEFVIRIQYDNAADVLTGKEDLHIALENPHKEGYDSTGYQILKLIIDSLKKQNND